MVYGEASPMEETNWLKEVNSQNLQYDLPCLETAYQNSFRGQASFPGFRSRRHKNAFRVPQFVCMEEDRLHIPKFKTGLKVKVHRLLSGPIRHCTISKTTSGKYFVSLLCEEFYQGGKKAKR